MNSALDTLAAETGLAAPSHESLRLAFGHRCALRIEHLLEQAAVRTCLDQLGLYLRGEIEAAALKQAQQEADRLANRHPGSMSIDGCGHAAVSASYAVAHALNGRALQAAGYAAYAKVYADGGYAAVAEQESFEPEFSWQVATLRTLAAAAEGSETGRTAARLPEVGVGNAA